MVKLYRFIRRCLTSGRFVSAELAAARANLLFRLPTWKKKGTNSAQKRRSSNFAIGRISCVRISGRDAAVCTHARRVELDDREYPGLAVDLVAPPGKDFYARSLQLRGKKKEKKSPRVTILPSEESREEIEVKDRFFLNEKTPAEITSGARERGTRSRLGLIALPHPTPPFFLPKLSRRQARRRGERDMQSPLYVSRARRGLRLSAGIGWLSRLLCSARGRGGGWRRCWRAVGSSARQRAYISAGFNRTPLSLGVGRSDRRMIRRRRLTVACSTLPSRPPSAG